ncbi:MAG: response regulator [Planctomycetota bacterium]|jgi:CheY-like chemotaxis protein
MADILVIDDEPHFRSALKRALELEGHQVRTAADGEEGVVEYRHEPSDLVIVDLYMPRKSGLQAILDLRNEFGGVRIIAVTGSASGVSDYKLEAAAALGAQRTLRKPFDDAQLLEAVRAVLEDENNV